MHMAQHKDALSFGFLTNAVAAAGHVIGGLTTGVAHGTTVAVEHTAAGVGAAVGQVTDLPTDAISAMVDGIVTKVVAGFAASMGVSFLVNKLHVNATAATALPGLAAALAVAGVHLAESHLHARPTPVKP
jgi:hypothetical protein